MGMFNFDINKIKQKLEEDKKKYDNAKSKKREFDITKETLLKVSEAGEYNFRAVPYVKHKDFVAHPFPERFYHFGIPGSSVFYCPTKNSGGKEKCAVCDFVWERMKENKGNKPEIDKWRKFLPKKRLWIPGILRGRENEGLKYFLLSTLEDKMGENHEKLFKWLQGKSTYYFLDPENGFDILLKYEAYDVAKSKMLGGAKFGFAGFDLDREETAISDNVEETWTEIEQTMKDVDVDIERYERKTESESLSVLESWLNAETKKSKQKKENKPVDENQDDDGTVIETKEVDDDDKPVSVQDIPLSRPRVVNTEESSNLSSDVEDRKARARKLLSKMNRE